MANASDPTRTPDAGTPTRRLLLRRAAGALPLLGAGLPLLGPPAPALAEPARPAALTLPAPSRFYLERYKAWLYQEHRTLGFEMYPGRDERIRSTIVCDAAVNLWHFPRLPGPASSPSARAIPMLWALDLLEGER